MDEQIPDKYRAIIIKELIDKFRKELDELDHVTNQYKELARMNTIERITYQHIINELHNELRVIEYRLREKGEL